MQGKKQYTGQLFTSFQLSQRVPEDNFYRRLKDLLDLGWLYKATKQYYGTEGQQSIDPVVFFRLILIGYLENLASDRRIITTVSMRMDMLYFLGYDIDEPLPWHSTLSRTRQLYGEEVFKDFFKQVLRQCIDKGMVAGKRQAIDSVAVKAAASMSKLAEKEVLEDADVYTAELQREQDRDEKDKDENDKTGASYTVSATKHKSVGQHHRWKRKAFKGKPGANSSGAKFVSNHTHYSLTDADARISVKPGKPRQLNYHAQVSVDTAHHVITAIESHTADKRDSQCLASITGQAVNNLLAEGLRVEEVLCDTRATAAAKPSGIWKKRASPATSPTLVSTRVKGKASPIMKKRIIIPAQQEPGSPLKESVSRTTTMRCASTAPAVKTAKPAL